jgi:hypothetical protein
MALLLAGFLHMLLLSPLEGSVAALDKPLGELSAKKEALAKEAAAFNSDKQNLRSGLLALKDYFKVNFASAAVELIQSDLALLAGGVKNRHLNMEFALKKIYFVETLDIRANLKAAGIKDLLDFIEGARCKYFMASKMITLDRLDEKEVDISYDFYIPFNKFKIRSLIEGGF